MVAGLFDEMGCRGDLLVVGGTVTTATFDTQDEIEARFNQAVNTKFYFIDAAGQDRWQVNHLRC